MDVSLVMVKSDGSSREIKLAREATIIGRDESAKLRIPVSSVSRKHCEVRVDDDGDGVSVADLGSANGTYVNGKRVRQAELAPGDLLSVGPVVFVVRMDGHPKTIDAKDSYAAGSVTDDNDDTGEFLSPIAPTKAKSPGPSGRPSAPPPTVIAPPTPGEKPPAKDDGDDDDDDDNFSDLLKDFDFGEDEDEPPKKA
ncbi:MAG: FHA domain-containing protein [Phycisphaerales bacterium]